MMNVPAIEAVSLYKPIKSNNMSDTEMPGTPASAPSEPAPMPASSAPAPTAETSAPASAEPNTPFGTFGNARGSGLARGKRSTSTAAPSSSAAVSSDYKPTAIQMLTPEREYKHPFAPATPAPVEAPAPVAAKEPQPAPVSVPAAEAAPAPVPEVPAPSVPAEKATLKILPPEESRRAPESWDSGSFRKEPRGEFRPRREERGSFRSERREEPRLEQREQRPAQPKIEQRAPLPESKQPKPSGGFVGWLKGLFGGKPESPGSESGAGDKSFGGGNRHRRHRHRGSRDFQGGFAPRESGQPGSNEGQQGNYGGERRRRRRGGRGRHHGGGDFRGGSGSQAS